MEREILVRGARTNNLKDVSVSIPHGRLTVVTGVSGSGKSSLAFDTLYAEGQRLYVESMSAYARQFLERMQRPAVDSISGMLPSIALEQKNTVTNARSTVGTATETNDFLRLLFANVGHTICPDCGVEAEKHNPQTAARFLETLPDGTRFLILAPLAVESKRRLGFLRQSLASAGFRRAFHGGEAVELKEVPDEAILDEGTLEIAVDRLTKRADGTSRAADSLEMAFHISARGAIVQLLDGEGRPTERQRFFAGFVCRTCGREFREPQPEMFSFNSGVGACPRCEGFGRVSEIDFEKVIPDPRLSLKEGAVAPWSTPAYHEVIDWFFDEARKAGVPIDVPYGKLTAAQKRWVIEGNPNPGDDEDAFRGIRGFFGWLERKKYKVQNRIIIARYRRFVDCPDCGGSRLRPDARYVKVGGRTFGELLELPIPDLRQFFESLTVEQASRLLLPPRQARCLPHLSPAEAEAARSLLREIHARLEYLEDIGLPYLTLSRQTRTLSGGEAQRIHLASALGSSLTNVLYVLDEPTVGLHAADTQRLLSILRALTEKGNTVVCVEHDPEIIEGAAHVIDLGPGAGEDGGRVVFEGTVQDLLSQSSSCSSSSSSSTPALRRGKRRVENEDEDEDDWKPRVGEATAPSATAEYLRRRQTLRWPNRGRVPKRFIEIRGATQHNLRNLDVRIPLGVLACVTGVSGAGKSTLVNMTLYANYRRLRGATPVGGARHASPLLGRAAGLRGARPNEFGRGTQSEAGACKALVGLDQIEDIILVDQTPIGRSIRSNAATYTKAYDDIRRLFAETRRARTLGITAAHFSFNIPGGRCEACQGVGTQTIDMQFLADVTVVCDICGGHRFQKRVLEVTHRGRTILDVLAMTVAEAMEFFEETPTLVAKLRPLAEVGLGYLRLGQNTSTLSGGEAQRLKLASYLGISLPKVSHPSPLPKVSHLREGNEDASPHTLPKDRNLREGVGLFIFNEPTVGLHMADVQVLMGVLQRLVDEGHSVLLVEHNLDVISQADWIIDLGPGGGAAGGELVAEGPPEAITACERSATGKFLERRFGGEARKGGFS